MSMIINGTVLSTLLVETSGSMASTAHDSVQITLEGFMGDRHFGYTLLSGGRTPQYPRGTSLRNSRQVSILSKEELHAIAQDLALPEIKPEWLGANLCLQSIPSLTQLPPGTRLHFPDEAVLVVESENAPCSNPGKIIQAQYPHLPNLVSAFIRAALHRRGIVAWVERAGKITVGDSVRAEIPKYSPYPTS